MKKNIIKALVAASILAIGICFTGCGIDDRHVYDVAEVNSYGQEQEEKYEKYGVLYYADAEVVCVEVFDGETNVWCLDSFGQNYVFHGDGFEVGDKICFEVGDNDTENDREDDIIIDVLVY